MSGMQKVSCIIPAYNEAARIRDVLRAAVGHPYVSEVIAVDDGSRDGTGDAVRQFAGVRIITHAKNEGKCRTIADGIEASREDILLFLDADLMGLMPDDISRLVEPVISGRADVAISLRKNAPPYYRAIGLDFISGERVLRRELLTNHLNEIRKLPGFGFEVYMNGLIVKNRCRIKVVPWVNVISPWKHTKAGFWKGIAGEIRMNFQVLKTVSALGALRQMLAMRALRVS
ncbi:MAG: glycosyltransferase family 2 protein [Candidatus Jorgensenbacteria bacterium]